MNSGILASKLLTWFTVGFFASAQLFPAHLCAQETAAGQSSELKIVIIEGEGGVNNIKKGTATMPVVEVRDRNDKPVAGAVVVFMLPGSGPSGTFANGSKLFTAVTDSNGRVAATLRPNNVPGQFKIDVSASHQGKTAKATINQTNAVVGAAAGAAGISALKIALIAGAAAGAATGIAVGLTLVAAVFLSLLGRLAELNLPVIGRYIAQIVRMVHVELRALPH